MIIRALNTIGLVAAMVLAVALYRAKSDAHEARERLDQLTILIEEERKASGVLRAEIAFLERPERLRALAARYLGLEPTDPSREMSLEQTLLALGVPGEDAPRYAEAGDAVTAPVAVAEAAPAPAPEAVAAPEPAFAPASSRVAEAEIAPEPAPTRVAEARIDSAPLAPVAAPMPQSDDPIASLIIAAGGLR